MTLLVGCSNARSEDAAATKSAAGAAIAGPADTAARIAQTLTLAPTDVSIAQTASIVDGVPITGNLRPIETVSVRARLEGDLEGIYVREGNFVRAGQLLARFESTEQESGVQSAAADKAAAEGDLATAEWNLKQSEDLFKAGAIAEGELRVARNAVGTARARLAAADSRLRSTSSSNRDTRVLSPTSGTVEKRFVENGEHIARGAEMFSVVRNDVLELAAAVPEKLAGSVAPGQSVEFLANARTFLGRVARVSPTVDPMSRSVTVYVQVRNANGALKGGTFATGTVQTRTIANAITIPTSAIKQTAEGKSIVYRIAAGTLDAANVEIGVTDDRAGIAEVVSGLSVGDSVVSGNVGTLGKGMKIQVVSPNAGRARGSPAPGAPAPRQP
ncbi:MAG: efflux RND transporter periplasmic adaptor subunit [Gemmatimonadaceae bacterium]|nr:efflux RND transporter periplasmic adaptor subunit [Gemmatimonadaceae bacterium]